MQGEPDKEAAIYAIQILTSIIVDFMPAGDNDGRNLIVGHRRRRLITAISSKWGAVMKRVSSVSSEIQCGVILTLA